MTDDPSGASTHDLRVREQEFRFHRFGVTVLDGPDRGAHGEHSGSELTVGRARGNQIVLADPTVSMHHCSVAATADGFLLRDLGSRNGTILAGHRVMEAYLKPGSVVSVGVTTLRFDVLGDEVREPLSASERFGRMLGRSTPMRRIFAMLPKIAASDATVLIEGETGTGKGVLADAIHQASPRASGPLIVLDCGALPRSLIESELFGHERGAFTGAHSQHTGVFETAHGGTLFLDEIGELPLDLQPKLLRALEERSIRRVGGSTPIALDVRVIAATNRDLRSAVNRNAFRTDLYYRLNVIRIEVPPLRERREDIALLAASFHEHLTGRPPPADLIESLPNHDWPGNVRELRSAIERIVLLDDIDAAILPPPSASPIVANVDEDPFAPDQTFRNAKAAAIARWERWYLQELLRRHHGNASQVARSAQMDRSHLGVLLKRYGLSRGSQT